MQIGNINLMLLKALKDSSKYGLEIIKYISNDTNGEVEIKQPSLYSGLTRLEKRGLITSYWEDSDIGGRRHYYTITDMGLNQLKIHQAELDEISKNGISANAKEKDDEVDDEEEPTSQHSTKTTHTETTTVREITKTQIEKPITNEPQKVTEAKSTPVEEKPQQKIEEIDSTPIETISLSKTKDFENEKTDDEKFDEFLGNLWNENENKNDLHFEDTESDDTISEPSDIDEDDETVVPNEVVIKDVASPTPMKNPFYTGEKKDFVPPKSVNILNTNSEQVIQKETIEAKVEHKIEKQEEKSTQMVNPTIQNNSPTFAPYNPTTDKPVKKSFSQKMRDYVEPQNKYEEYEIKPVTIEQKPVVKENIVQNEFEHSSQSTIQQNTNSQVNQFDFNQDKNFGFTNLNNNNIQQQTPMEKVSTYSAPQMNETQVQYINKKENQDIDYKNILGDLDADLNRKENVIPMAREPIAPIEKNATQKESKRSAYSKRLEEILVSTNGTNGNANLTNKKIERIDNEKRFEELNRKYESNVELKALQKNKSQEDEITENEVHAIEPKSVGFNHLNQEKITVKPYVQSVNTKSADKIYLLSNKYNLFRAFIMVIIMAIELGLSYYLCSDAGLINNTTPLATTLYIIAGSIGALYFILMLSFCLPNLDKKIQHENISWGMDLFYRCLLTVILLTFVIALNLFLGMTNLLDVNYFAQWFIPSIMIINILLSSPIGYIIYKTKAFRI